MDSNMFDRDAFALYSNEQFVKANPEQRQAVLGTVFDERVAPRFAGMEGVDLNDTKERYIKAHTLSPNADQGVADLYANNKKFGSATPEQRATVLGNIFDSKLGGDASYLDAGALKNERKLFIAQNLTTQDRDSLYGTLSKVWDIAKDIPRQIGTTLLVAGRDLGGRFAGLVPMEPEMSVGEDSRGPGSLISADGNDLTDKSRRVQERDNRLRKAKYDGNGGLFQNKYFDLSGAGDSAGFGLASGLPAQVGGMVGGPVGAAIGAAASAPVALFSQSGNFLTDNIDAVNADRKAKGQPRMNQQEQDELTSKLASAATQYGAWEAVPEAVANAITGGVVGKLVHGVAGKTVLGKAAKAAGALALDLGSEHATETASQWGQGALEAEAGLRDKAPTWGEAFQEQAATTNALFGSTHAIGIGGGKLAKAVGVLHDVRPEAEKGGGIDLTMATTPVDQLALPTAGQLALPPGSPLALPPSGGSAEDRAVRTMAGWTATPDLAKRIGGEQEALPAGSTPALPAGPTALIPGPIASPGEQMFGGAIPVPANPGGIGLPGLAPQAALPPGVGAIPMQGQDGGPVIATAPPAGGGFTPSGPVIEQPGISPQIALPQVPGPSAGDGSFVPRSQVSVPWGNGGIAPVSAAHQIIPTAKQARANREKLKAEHARQKAAQAADAAKQAMEQAKVNPALAPQAQASVQAAQVADADAQVAVAQAVEAAQAAQVKPEPVKPEPAPTATIPSPAPVRAQAPVVKPTAATSAHDGSLVMSVTGRDSTRADVHATEKGFAVSIHDTEDGGSAQSVTIYPDKESAISAAQAIVTGEAPQAKDLDTDSIPAQNEGEAAAKREILSPMGRLDTVFADLYSKAQADGGEQHTRTLPQDTAVAMFNAAKAEARANTKDYVVEPNGLFVKRSMGDHDAYVTKHGQAFILPAEGTTFDDIKKAHAKKAARTAKIAATHQEAQGNGEGTGVHAEAGAGAGGEGTRNTADLETSSSARGHAGLHTPGVGPANGQAGLLRGTDAAKDSGRPADQVPRTAREGDYLPPVAVGKARPIRAVSGVQRELFPAHYELRELDDLTASHLPLEGYRKNPAYPTHVQERPYDTSENHQQAVRDRAMRFDADELVNTAVSAETGPSVITSDGVVVGGNSRKMVLEILRDKFPERYAAYADTIRSEAESFGLEPSALDDFQNPVLVRALEFASTDKTSEELGRISGVLNKAQQTGQDKTTKGVAMAKALSRETLDIFARGIGAHEGTLRDFLDSTYARDHLVSALESDGVFDVQNRDQYLDNGHLLPEGKAMVESTLRGLVVPDNDLLQRMRRANADTLKTFDAALPHMAYVKALGGEEVTPTARGAIKLLLDYAASKSAWASKNKGNARKYGPDFYLLQPSLIDEISELRADPSVRATFRGITELSPREFAPKWKTIAASYRDMLSLPRMPGIDVDPRYLKKAIERVMTEHDSQQERAPRSVKEVRDRERAEAAQAAPLSPDEIRAAEEADAQDREQDAPALYRTTSERNMQGMDISAVDSHIATVAEGWANMPPVEVVQSESDLPDAVLDGATGAIQGAYHGGKIYIVADNNASPGEVEKTLTHEVLRHHGLRLALGAQYGPTMQQAWHNPKVNARAQEVAAEHGWTAEQLASNKTLRNAATDEALAQLGDEGVRNRWYDKVVSSVQGWLRKVGLGGKFSDSEVRSLVTAASEAARTGRGAQKASTDGAPVYRQRTSEANADRQTGEEALRAGIPHNAEEADRSGFWDALKRAGQDIKNSKEQAQVSGLKKTLMQGYWLAKRFPDTIGHMMRAQMDAEESRHEGLHEVLDGTVKAVKNLSGESMRKLADVVHQLDGKTLSGITASKFLGRTVNGVTDMKLNEKHYVQMRDVLLGEHVPADVTDAYIIIRKGLDTTLIQTFHKMQELRVDANLIDRFRSQIGQIQNYFPHVRFGDHFINVKDSAGETIYNEHVDTSGPGGRIRLAQREMAVEKMYPDAKADGRITSKKMQSIPETVYEQGINTNDIAQVIEEALKHTENVTEEMKNTVRREISKQVADVLLSRGWGQHARARKNIPGYERQDIGRVLVAYHSGHQGWLHKIDKAQKFANILASIKAKNDPNLYAWAKQFSKDMLRNQDSTDNAIAKARSLMSVMYIGGRISTAFTNLTQNLILGIPTLSQHIGLPGAAKVYLQNAVRSVAYMASGEKVREAHMRPGELAFLQDFHDRGITEANFMHELAGLDGSALDVGVQNVIKTLFVPFTVAERFNRVSLALATYRAARDGKITNAKTLEKYGKEKGQKFSEADARDIAREVTLDAHFLTGKANLPEIVRGKGRAVATPAYTFRGYQHGLLSAWRFMLTHQGIEGRKAFVYSLASTAALGGIASLPMFALITAAARSMGGDDWDRDLYKALRGVWGDKGADVGMYGVGALAGITLAPSMGMDLPILSDLREDKPVVDQAMGKMVDLLGVPTALIKQVGRAAHFWNLGDSYRAFETMAPGFVAAPLRAYRLHEEGATSVSGKPLATPGTQEQFKLTDGEAALQALGFSPLSKVKVQDSQASVQKMEEHRKALQEVLVARYVQARKRGDQEAMDELLTRRNEFNAQMSEEGHPGMKIQPLGKLAIAAMKMQRPSKKLRGEYRDASEAFGVGD